MNLPKQTKTRQMKARINNHGKMFAKNVHVFTFVHVYMWRKKQGYNHFLTIVYKIFIGVSMTFVGFILAIREHRFMPWLNIILCLPTCDIELNSSIFYIQIF